MSISNRPAEVLPSLRFAETFPPPRPAETLPSRTDLPNYFHLLGLPATFVSVFCHIRECFLLLPWVFPVIFMGVFGHFRECFLSGS